MTKPEMPTTILDSNGLIAASQKLLFAYCPSTLSSLLSPLYCSESYQRIIDESIDRF